MEESKFDVAWRYVVGNDGWVRVEAHPVVRDSEQPVPPGHVLFVRFAPAGDHLARLQIVETFMFRADGGPVTGSAWRKVKLSEIEKIPHYESAEGDSRDTLRGRMGLPGPLLRTAAEYFSTTYGAPLDHWVAKMMWSQLPDSGSEWVDPPKPPQWQQEWSVWMEERDLGDFSLPDPDTSSPDFLRAVAAAYNELVALGLPPAPTIADANGVDKVTKVHYWIRKARDEGFLEPGRRGRAG